MGQFPEVFETARSNRNNLSPVRETADKALVATVVRWVACPELVNRDQRLRRSSRQCS